MEAEFLKRLEDIKKWYDEEFSKNFNEDTPLWQLEQENKALAERYSEFGPLLNEYNSSYRTNTDVDLDEQLHFYQLYGQEYENIRQGMVKVDTLYRNKQEKYDAIMKEIHQIQEDIETNASLIQRTRDDLQRTERQIRVKEASTTSRFSEAEIRMDRERYELIQNQIADLEKKNQENREAIERLNRDANIIMMGYNTINQAPDLNVTNLVEETNNRVIEPVLEEEQTLENPVIDENLTEEENPVLEVTRVRPVHNTVILTNPTWNIPKYWNPDLTEEQYQEALNRGITTPGGPEYNEYISSLGLNPARRALFWHPYLSNEEIEEANALGITEPNGSDYDQFLLDHGLSTTYDAVITRKPLSKFRPTIEEEVINKEVNAPLESLAQEPEMPDYGIKFPDLYNNNEEETKENVEKNNEELTKENPETNNEKTTRENLGNNFGTVKPEVVEPVMDDDDYDYLGITEQELSTLLGDLNPLATFTYNDDFTELYSSMDPEGLKLPDGFEYIDGEVTNKNTVIGKEPTSLKVTYKPKKVKPLESAAENVNDYEISDQVYSARTVAPKETLLKKFGKFLIRAAAWLSLLGTAIHTGKMAEYLKNQKTIVVEKTDACVVEEEQKEETKQEEEVKEEAVEEKVEEKPTASLTKEETTKKEEKKQEKKQETNTNKISIEQPSSKNDNHGSFLVDESTGDLINSDGEKYSLNQDGDYEKTGTVDVEKKDGVSYVDQDVFNQTVTNQNGMEDLFRSNNEERIRQEILSRGGK